MYLDFFGLSRSAFPVAPVSECFFGFTQSQLNVETIQDGLIRGAGPSILVGPSGSGKSMILSVLEDLNKNRFKTIRINASGCTNRADLIQTFLFELGLGYEQSNLNRTRLELISNLKKSAEFQNGILLLIDDAHHLDTGALEELESLSEIYRSSQSVIQMIFSGNSSLEERLSHPSLDSLNQKIATRSYLHGVDLCQLSDYLVFQIERAGGQNLDLFSEDAVVSIHNATYGNIRLINQLCDYCLVLAAKNRTKRLDASFVQSAWSQWQQIPSSEPTSDRIEDCPHGDGSNSSEAQGDSIIAFGSLDDSPADMLESFSEYQPMESNQVDKNDVLEIDNQSGDERQISASEMPTVEIVEEKQVMSVDAAVQNAKAAQKKIETFITFAFEQDIQKPARPVQSNSMLEVESDDALSRSEPEKNHNAIQPKRVVPAGLMSAWSPSFDRLPSAKISENIKSSEQESKKVRSEYEVESDLIKDLDQQFSKSKRVIKPATDPPVVDCVAKAQKSISQIDSMLHAIDSLDSDWAEVEKVLAESDLEIANRQKMDPPVDKQEPAATETEAEEFFDKPNEVLRRPVQPITAKNKDELFGSRELYSQQEKVVNDVDWTEFLKPIQPAAAQHDLPLNKETEETVSPEQLVAESMLEHEGDSQVEIVPILHDYSTSGNEQIDPNFHPQSDDRRIITPSDSDDETEGRKDPAHANSKPKIAKRKDLRALLTSLRGF